MRFMIGFLSLSMLVLTLAGCGSAKPEDFPEVFPTTLTVTKAGAPVANLDVVFNATGAMKYAVAGKTDASGKAVLSTRASVYTENGAPAGSYKVTFSADLVPPSKMTEAQEDALTGEERKAYFDKLTQERQELAGQNPVPSSLRIASSSALTLDVPDGGADLTVEFDDYPHDAASTEGVRQLEGNTHP